MPLLSVRELRVELVARGALGQRRGVVRAVDSVSFDVTAGETLGVVGESGCGKSTLARAVLGLVPATAGSVRFAGTEVVGASAATLRPLRRRMQIILQDPYGSLDPRMTVGESVAEGLDVHRLAWGEARTRRVQALLDLMGLPADAGGRYPHELSGGQRQRVAIARALAVEPALVVADEPLSALDVSVQAQIVNLFQDLQRDLGLSFVFIAHDLRMVRHVSDRVAVMYLGRVVELGPAEAVGRTPRHPYAQALVAAMPSLQPEPEGVARLAGEPASALDPPPGCAFHPRCPLATARCRGEVPVLHDVGPEHAVACHVVEQERP